MFRCLGVASPSLLLGGAAGTRDDQLNPSEPQQAQSMSVRAASIDASMASIDAV
jgi:hypothetical protein